MLEKLAKAVGVKVKDLIPFLKQVLPQNRRT